MDKNKQQKISSGLYLVSTPIGNMEDITFRALNILKKSDIVLCEDTRRSLKLFSYFKIKQNNLIAYHKFNEKKISLKIIESLKKNKIISLISDAGTPVISDPGKILIKKCIEENINIFPIPGASAVTSAVSISGFSDQYLFYGFPPKKEKELENVLKNLNNLDFSIVFFVPISKINFYLLEFKKYFYDREILIAREMTKIHERFTRDKINQIKNLPDILKGEITIVISNKEKNKNIQKIINENIKKNIKKMLSKYSHKDVVDFISQKEGLPKKLIYDYCLKLKK